MLLQNIDFHTNQTNTNSWCQGTLSGPAVASRTWRVAEHEAKVDVDQASTGVHHNVAIVTVLHLQT
jgi:uncharacterized protein YecA (UPF0149 family)